MIAQARKREAVDEVYSLLRQAAVQRQPVAAMYEGRLRLLCPHVLGRKADRLHGLFYQYGGSSRSGLPVKPEGVGEWRCLSVKKLSQVEFRSDLWHTEPRALRQTCVDAVDLDVDDQPGGEPQ
jgi:hypothetical protein